MTHETRLKRVVSFPLLLLYGLGTTVGAGIYALVGEVAAEAGAAAPIAFALASGLATITALSFAELSARHPRAAGEAVYVDEAFHAPALASMTGLLVALSGWVSAATITTAFAAQVAAVIDLPRVLVVTTAVCLLGMIAAWGIRESLTLAGLVTLIEVGGLLLVAWTARDALVDLPERLDELLPGSSSTPWPGVLGGALLAFYAFLGFEDMVNVAEEVEDVRRTLPLAIVATLITTTILYVLIATTAVLSVPLAELAASAEPLTLIYRRAGGPFPSTINLIALIALLNGALVQLVMSARVLYGLAGGPLVPAFFGRVHPRTATPVAATAFGGCVVLALALFVPLRELAAVTSMLTLLVFAAVNGALLRLQLREPTRAAWRRLPSWLPATGMSFNLGFLIWSVGHWISSWR